MENASKALIIAGAILLAILIISLGIFVYRQASGAINSGGMDEVQLATFNAKFRQYEGTQTGSVVKDLINTVLTNNNADEASEDTYVIVTIDGASVFTNNSTPTQINTDGEPYKNIKKTKKYTVTCIMDGSRVKTIEVKSKTNNQNS